jgi:hypothetical protein
MPALFTKLEQSQQTVHEVGEQLAYMSILVLANLLPRPSMSALLVMSAPAHTAALSGADPVACL